MDLTRYNFQDNHGNNLEQCREYKEHLCQFEAMKAACEEMLQCTGGSQYWNGATYDALRSIEIALGVDV